MKSAKTILGNRGDSWRIHGRSRVQGRFRPPADKSILHRTFILAALADGDSLVQVQGSPGEDVLRTAQALRQLGVEFRRADDHFEVRGRGLHGLHVSRDSIDCGNSGTTMRLLSGVLAAQPFSTTLRGDASLMRRPMQRLAAPLRKMGASFETEGIDGRPPVRVGLPPGSWLRGTTHRLAVDSAQVRTAILLAGLYAHGPTVLLPSSAARDHTQRMLAALGIAIQQNGDATQLQPTLSGAGFPAFRCAVPGDVSAAAFTVALACAVPACRLVVESCGLNPGRIRYLEILRQAGARLEMRLDGFALGEPIGRVRARGGKLASMLVEGDDLVACVDEVPALAAAGAIAGCAVTVRDASELRVKESDRIAGVVELLSSFGAKVSERRDGFTLAANATLRPARVVTHGDHRLAMAAAMLASRCDGTSSVDGVGCVATSYPDFVDDFNRLCLPMRS